MVDGEWHVDRQYWPPGEWDAEPDFLQWDAYALTCIAARLTMFGAWCGYVAVPLGHRLHGATKDVAVDVDGQDLPSHGGITYAGPELKPICHQPQMPPGAKPWWLGFDCAHASDHQPGMPRVLASALRTIPHYRYRSLTYVTTIVHELARAIARG